MGPFNSTMWPGMSLWFGGLVPIWLQSARRVFRGHCWFSRLRWVIAGRQPDMRCQAWITCVVKSHNLTRKWPTGCVLAWANVFVRARVCVCSGKALVNQNVLAGLQFESSLILHLQESAQVCTAHLSMDAFFLFLSTRTHSTLWYYAVCVWCGQLKNPSHSLV